MSEPSTGRRPGDTEISAAVRRAAAGDATSVATIVDRYTPALLMQAEHRLSAALRRHVEPLDVVNDVWLRVLPKLADFAPAPGAAAATLLEYLGTAVLRRVHEIYRKRLAGKPVLVEPRRDPAASAFDPLAVLSAHVTGAVTQAVRGERRSILRRAIDELDETDRAVVVMRAIEGQPNDVVAAAVGLTPNAVSQRLRRAIEKLRATLPSSVFHDLADD